LAVVRFSNAISDKNDFGSIQEILDAEKNVSRGEIVREIVFAPVWTILRRMVVENFQQAADRAIDHVHLEWRA